MKTQDKILIKLLDIEEKVDKIYTKEDIDLKFTKLQSAVDGIAKSVDELKTEKVITNSRLGNIEKRIGILPS